MKLMEGITYIHEHTTIDLSEVKACDDCYLDCFTETVKEFKALYDLGVRNIIDVTNYGMNPNPEYVQKVAQRSRINILQATGFYQQKFLPAFVQTASVQQLEKMMLKDIEEGFSGTNVKAAVIGEIATSKNEMTADEQKVFTASVAVAKQTGKNIMTHTTLGTYGMQQLHFFKKHEFPLERVMIGHVDLTGDVEYILNLLTTGAYVAFDTIGKNNYQPDTLRAEMLKQIDRAGYIDKVCLSMDITRKSNLGYKGGIGYAYLLETFVPLLKEHGVSKRSIEKLLWENPQAFFATST